MKWFVGCVAGMLLAWSLAGCVTRGGAAKGDEVMMLKAVTSVSKVAQLTGADSVNATDRYNVYGTDLGSIFEHEGLLYIVFGDTFGPRAVGQTGGGGSLWRSNTMAFTSDFDASDGIRLDGMIVDSTGTAKELVHSPKINGSEITKIPTSGVSADGNIYLYFMSVNTWGTPGRWDCNFAGVAKSSDDGKTWNVIDGLQWPGESNFIQFAIAPAGDYLYFWGIPAGRFGGVQLARVKPAELETIGSYEYYVGARLGAPAWSRSQDKAETIVGAPVGELSVVWNPYLDRWIMTYLNEKTHAIEIREAVAPWGPWSQALTVCTAAQYPAPYGAFMHPRYTEESGRVIYFLMSQWDPYNVFVMRAELVKRDEE